MIKLVKHRLEAYSSAMQEPGISKEELIGYIERGLGNEQSR